MMPHSCAGRGHLSSLRWSRFRQIEWGTAEWLIDDDQAYELVGTVWNARVWVILKLEYLQLIVFYCVCIVLAWGGVDWVVWDCLGSMGCMGGKVSLCGSFLGILCFLMHCSG